MITTRVYCVNCRKGLHNTKDKERCRGKDCECRCRYFYVDGNGYLVRNGDKPKDHPEDNKKELAPLSPELIAMNKKHQDDRNAYQKKLEEFGKSSPLGISGETNDGTKEYKDEDINFIPANTALKEKLVK